MESQSNGKYEEKMETRTVRILLPIVLPSESAMRRKKRKIMWMLTWRSTAVRLIGAALRRMLAKKSSQRT